MGTTDVKPRDVGTTDVKPRDVGTTDVKPRDVGTTDVKPRMNRRPDITVTVGWALRTNDLSVLMNRIISGRGYRHKPQN